MKIDVEAIKKLREATGAGVADCRMALEQSKGDAKKATEILRKKGIEKADKKSDRQVKAGMVFTYAHHTGRVGVILALACETDFVAKTDDFKNLCREIAMQVCVGDYKDAAEVLSAEYIRDSDKKVGDLIIAATAKMGEKIELKRFVKFAVGELR